jgi:hypothetical protein
MEGMKTAGSTARRGASPAEKIVIVDDEPAFVGGIDPTAGRRPLRLRASTRSRTASAGKTRAARAARARRTRTNLRWDRGGPRGARAARGARARRRRDRAELVRHA